jgi:hypothetical protein
LGAAFLVFAKCFGFAVFDGRAFAAVLRVVVLTALARFAFGLADLALTARFAVLADERFPADLAVDRRKPFVRLLLMGGFSKGCSHACEQPQNARSLP